MVQLSRPIATNQNGPPVKPPPGLEKIRAEVVLVTPEMAREWVERCNFEDRQRSLRQWHIMELAEAIKRGELELSLVKFSVFEGREYLIDGQHRLWSIFVSKVPAVLVVSWEEKPSMREVAYSYIRTDNNMTRSFADARKATAADASSGLTVQQFDKMGAAATLILMGFEAVTSPTKSIVSRDKGARLAAVHKWAPDAQMYFEAITGAPKSLRAPLRNAGCLAVGTITMRYSVEKAAVFWKTVAGNDQLRRDSPEQALVHLLTTKNTNEMSRAGWARAVASCWNAYLANKNLPRVVPTDIRIPINIEGGSPYDGKQIILPGTEG